VRFVVSSDDVARFLNRSGVASENVTVGYRTSVVSYGENATVERSGEGYAVTDAAGTVTENRSLAPGATAAALDGSVVAAADVAPARPAPGERVTVDGSLSVGLNTSIERYEWTIVGGAGGNGTDDPAGNRTTGNGTSATGPTLTRSFETAGTKRVRLTVTGADGASDSTTVAVRVVPPAPDVNGNGRAATDPDGDGRYEDVTGDGMVDVVDVAVLLARFDDPVVRDAVGQFDFDGSGAVNVVDVAELLRSL
jgi:minor extracellular serine protease Vpr